VANFRHLATKKKGLAKPPNETLGIIKTNIRHISRKRKLEFARFRQFFFEGWKIAQFHNAIDSGEHWLRLGTGPS
jgi:hypothetical protein